MRDLTRRGLISLLGLIDSECEKALGETISGRLGFTVDANPKVPAFN